jgi:hypothetical protein
MAAREGRLRCALRGGLRSGRRRELETAILCIHKSRQRSAIVLITLNTQPIATKCKAVQFDIQATKTLHEKDLFIAFIRDECGLTVLKTFKVGRHQEALDILLPQYTTQNSSEKKRHFLESGSY